MRLFYDSTLVGEISDAFTDQGTWFGTFRQKLGDQGERLREFIDFCKAWHERLGAGEGGDASDFDNFGEVVTSGLWKVESNDGTVVTIEGCPVFIEDEITWSYL